ncbi:MAG: PIN domain-containing protein [Desulfosarcina sp.]|nr:PIN domain-containing protein [Desulfobacterales bacterium]
MYLFDTDVISNIFKPHPSELLLGKLGRLEQRDQYISTITIKEIVYGAVKSDRTEYHLRNLEELLLPSVNIASFDTKAAFICGHLRAALERQGRTLSLADMEIAAIAMANNFTLITGNIKHFERVKGLKLDNWLP